MRAIAAILVFLIASIHPALAEKRVALVIGNATYQSVKRLANPLNDAEVMTATLKDAGFDIVETKYDLNAVAMRRTLSEFTKQAYDADIAVIYYAGHGIEVGGNNYLVPIDAALERDVDAYDEAIPLDRLLAVIEPAIKLRLIILDACRDNPFARHMKRTVTTRAIGRGLARFEPNSPNTLIAFAARAGSTAADGGGKYSPFTASLVKFLTRPGLDLRKAFGYTRDEVLKITNNQQEPFLYGSLGGDDVALVPAPAAPPLDADIAVRHAYELAIEIGTSDIWDAFIARYPNSFYTDLAKAQRRRSLAPEQGDDKARLAEREGRDEAKTAAAERARLAAQAKAEEDARLAAARAEAEKRAAEAERARVAAAQAEAEAEEDARIAAVRAKAEEDARATAVQARADEDAKLAAAPAKAGDEKAPDLKPPQQLAALIPPDRATETSRESPGAEDIPRLLQAELRRVGCNTGSIDPDWNAVAQRSLVLFNKHAATRLDTKTASLDALDVVRSKPDRVCPLICEHGFKVDGNRCVKITCAAGFALNEDNECVRRREKPAHQERSVKHDAPNPDRPSSQAAPQRSGSGNWDPHDRNRRVTMGGQETCGPRGCQVVPKGCTAVRGMGGHGLGGKIYCP